VFPLCSLCCDGIPSFLTVSLEFARFEIACQSMRIMHVIVNRRSRRQLQQKHLQIKKYDPLCLPFHNSMPPFQRKKMLKKLPTLLFVATVFRESLSQKLPSEDERLELWAKGAFDLDSVNDGNPTFASLDLLRLGPVSKVRREVLRHRNAANCDSNGYCWDQFRGGEQSALDYNEQMDIKIQELGRKYGSEFMDAIEQNNREHAEDCKKSCEIYYCADKDAPLVALEDLMGPTSIKSYSMGPVPPEDFVSFFSFYVKSSVFFFFVS
jgi:hypothetical protein